MNKISMLIIQAQRLADQGLIREAEEVLDEVVEIQTPEISSDEALENLVNAVLSELHEHGTLNFEGNGLDEQSEENFENSLSNLLKYPTLN